MSRHSVLLDLPKGPFPITYTRAAYDFSLDGWDTYNVPDHVAKYSLCLPFSWRIYRRLIRARQKNAPIELFLNCGDKTFRMYPVWIRELVPLPDEQPVTHLEIHFEQDMGPTQIQLKDGGEIRI